MALETFYEESANNQKEKQHGIFHKILYVLQVICIVLAVGWLVLGGGFLPLPQEGESFKTVLPDWIFFFMLLLSFSLGALAFAFLKKRFNISYDYVCVSGELRISKVFNQRKRKLVCRLDKEDILQLGDVDSASYDRLRTLPGIKEIICTPNMVAEEGKFFMYVYAQYEGVKKLYLLECRESLLLNMMQYLRRDILDRDYVPQAKKM